MIEKQINDEFKTHKGHEKHHQKAKPKNTIGMVKTSKFNGRSKHQAITNSCLGQ